MAANSSVGLSDGPMNLVPIKFDVICVGPASKSDHPGASEPASEPTGNAFDRSGASTPWRSRCGS